jgi:hypothetical protein
MYRKILIPLIITTVIVFTLMQGGFVSFGQPFNTGKIGSEIVEDVQGAAGQTQENFAQGMAANEPVETAAPTAEEAVPVEQLDEDALRDAITAVNEYAMFAESASKVVRNYIRKIKIGQRQEDLVFPPGTAPWLSDNAEIRYSPFDPELGPTGAAPVIDVEQQLPFLPPQGGGVDTRGKLGDLLPLINLKMTTKQEGEFIALAEIAGFPVQLEVGKKIPLPEELGMEVFVEDISLNSVLLRSGSDHLIVPFAGGIDTKEIPFKIEIVR